MEKATDILGFRAHGFVTTCWAVLEACRNQDPAVARQALEEICQTYWYPVYAAIRRSGQGPADAQDLTQEFFLRMLKGRWIEYLDQAKGRFRAYLLTALKHFLHDDRRRRWTLRRGRGYQVISMDAAQAESRYALEPVTNVTPETLYEFNWANTITNQALEQLRIELTAGKRPELFDCFKSVIFDEASSTFYKDRAAELGMEVGALQTAVSRLRGRLRTLVREEISRTLSVSTDSEIEAEMQHLFRVLNTGTLSTGAPV